jgi:CRISPR-associated exonuclease Cas4
MEDPIIISNLNDFGFCPASIYFHNLMYGADRILTQTSSQINGTHSHFSIDNGSYSSRKSVFQGLEVYSEEYGLIGKIDIYYADKGLLVERKKKVSKLFDSQIFQIYGQYFAMCEMGYDVRELRIYSMDDNRNYSIPLPEDDAELFNSFCNVVSDMHAFNLDTFKQDNPLKCANCIYEVMCSCSVKEV